MTEQKKQSDRNLTWKLLGIAAGSFGFAFALVPLYKVNCGVTGVGDQSALRRKVKALEHLEPNRTITVEFLSIEGGNGEWDFRPV